MRVSDNLDYSTCSQSADGGCTEDGGIEGRLVFCVLEAQAGLSGPQARCREGGLKPRRGRTNWKRPTLRALCNNKRWGLLDANQINRGPGHHTQGSLKVALGSARDCRYKSTCCSSISISLLFFASDLHSPKRFRLEPTTRRARLEGFTGCVAFGRAGEEAKVNKFAILFWNI